MRVAIVGSRDYPDLEEVRQYVRSLEPGTVVVSGGARGVDRTAEDEAHNIGLEVKSWPADWLRYGKIAGFKRNDQIVQDSDMVVAFWDGKSKGTKHAINLAEHHGKPLVIHFGKGHE